jgi:hypothetical protein
MFWQNRLRQMVRAMLLFVLALTAAASVNAVPFGFNAFCNYPCHKDYQPGCLPQQFGMAACAQTRIGSYGAFPELSSTGKVTVNGGVPQAANMTEHMASLVNHLATWVPDVNFTGNIVIDFEAWTPIWEENGGASNWHAKRYQTFSEKLARAQHPQLNATAITAIAKRDFEAAAISFFVTTLEFFRAARPHARAGFYGFPGGMFGACLHETHDCGYNNPKIAPARRALNDGLAAIWNASGALYPSIYLVAPEKWRSNATTLLLNAAYINGTVGESIRLSKKYSESGTPILPYAWAMYHNGVTPLAAEAQVVVNNAVWRPPLCTGLVLWGGCSGSPAGRLVEKVETETLEHVVGPSMHAAQRATARCSEQRCGGHGWCDSINAATGCICAAGWTGDSCQHAA